jgi:hypothetical protein
MFAGSWEGVETGVYPNENLISESVKISLRGTQGLF